VPGGADGPEAAELRAENARLREAVERLGLLHGDKDAVIAGLRARLAEQAELIARLEWLISRNSRGMITRTAPSRTSRRVGAGAAGTWPGPVIWGSGTPARSPTCPGRARRPSSMTGMR